MGTPHDNQGKKEDDIGPIGIIIGLIVMLALAVGGFWLIKVSFQWIISGGNWLYIAFGAAALFSIAWVAVMGDYLRSVWLVKDTATSTIRGAAQGWVELIGKAKDLDESVPEMPYSRHPSPHYWAYIETVADGKRVVDDRRDPILLDDGTGVCYIRTDDMTDEFKNSTYQKLESLDDHQEMLRTMLAREEQLAAQRARWAVKDPTPTQSQDAPPPQDDPAKAWDKRWGTGPWYICEKGLTTDQTVYAIGLFETVRSHVDIYDAPIRKELVVVSDEEKAMTIEELIAGPYKNSLKNKVTELLRHREAWFAYCRKCEGIGPDEPLSGSARINTLQPYHAQNRQLILSDYEQEQVVKELWGSVWIGIIGTGLLGGLLAWLWFNLPFQD